MGVLGIFGAIAILACILGVIFTEQRKHKIGCAIAIAILTPFVATGFFLEAYAGNHPNITVETYRAFSINTYVGKVEFEEAQMIEKTNVRYGYGSVFYNNSTVYKVSPIESSD